MLGWRDASVASLMSVESSVDDSEVGAVEGEVGTVGAEAGDSFRRFRERKASIVSSHVVVSSIEESER